MKKVLFVLAALIMVAAMSSCKNKGSEAYQAVEKMVNDAQAKIEAATTCDDVDMVAISMLGDFMALSEKYTDQDFKEGEEKKVEELMAGLEKAMTDKKASLGCTDEIADEPVEEAAEEAEEAPAEEVAE